MRGLELIDHDRVLAREAGLRYVGGCDEAGWGCLAGPLVAAYSAGFDEIFRTEGAEIFTSPVRGPNANAHAERWVRTIRQECLDHLLIIPRRQLEAVLAGFVLHYNRGRPHRGLELCTPEARAVVAPTKLVSRLRSKKILGGLIHEYELAA